MKNVLVLLLALAAAGLQAGPVNPVHVSSEARWLVHLDLEAFRSSKLGGYIMREIVDKKIAQVPPGEAGVDLVALSRKISGLTAYGADFESRSGRGALVVSTDAEAIKVLEGMVAAEMLRKPDGPVKRTQEKPYPMYQLKSDVFAGLPGRGLVIFAKTRDQVEKAAQVAAGTKPSLKGTSTFQGLPATPRGTFLSAMAESFNQMAAIPPQARVLQMAESGRLVLGESADNLTLNLALRARTAEAGTQMRQLVEGLMALVSLSDSTNQDLLTLVRGLKVTNAENLVNLNFNYPVAEAIKKAAQKEGLPAPQP